MSDSPTFSGSQRGRWQPPDPVELQRQIAQYKVLELLGQGGMGAVYKGWQVSLERYVAIKILPPDVEDGDAHFVDRFKQEAKTMAKFLHPGIVAVFDAGETPSGLLYIVMEYVEGTDVAHMLQRKGLLDATTALAITANVCDALHYAHARGVIHRDIKPANIMVNEEGVVKVADFGLAKASGSMQMGLTRSDMSMGTPDFIAPEALMLGVISDHRADLYAVGVMLYNMLTGDIPRGRFKAASQRTGCDLRFDAIIDRAMEQDREHRYQSSQEIRRDLDVILTTPMEKAPPPEEAPAATTPLQRGAQPTMAAESSAAVSGAPATRQPAPASKKSSMGLAMTVLGAVAVLAVGAFFVFKKSAGETASVAPEKSGVSASPSVAEPWQDLSKDATLKGMEVTPNGITIQGWVTFPNGPKRDGAVRYRAPFSKDLVETLRPFVRKDKPGDFFGKWYQGHPNYEGDNAQVEITGSGSPPLTGPQHRGVPALKTGEMCEFELRVVGSKITVKLNGQIALEIEDTTLSAGHFGIWTLPKKEVVVQSLEVLNLDAHDVAASIPATPGSPSPTFSSFVPSAQWRSQSLDTPTKGGPYRWFPDKYTDGAVRMRFRVLDPKAHVDLMLRGASQDGKSARYHATLWTHITGGIFATASSHLVCPLKPPSDLNAGEVHCIEFYAIGDRLSFFLDGKQIASGTDKTLTEGYAAMTGADVDFLSVETADLGKTGAQGASTPAAAMKDTPFVNSLGIKFVPVPITGGPTD